MIRERLNKGDFVRGKKVKSDSSQRRNRRLRNSRREIKEGAGFLFILQKFQGGQVMVFQNNFQWSRLTFSQFNSIHRPKTSGKRNAWKEGSSVSGREKKWSYKPS